MTVGVSIENLTSDADRWREAIADTKSRLEQHKIQGYRLRQALRIFEENLLTEQPWPESQEKGSAGTENKAIPA